MMDINSSLKMASSAGSRDVTVVQAGLEYWETQPASLDGVLGTSFFPPRSHSHSTVPRRRVRNRGAHLQHPLEHVMTCDLHPVSTSRRCTRITPVPSRSHPRLAQRPLCDPSPRPILRSTRRLTPEALPCARRWRRHRTRHRRRSPPPRLGRRPPRAGTVVHRGGASTVSRDVHERREHRRWVDRDQRSDQERAFLQGPFAGL